MADSSWACVRFPAHQLRRFGRKQPKLIVVSVVEGTVHVGAKCYAASEFTRVHVDDEEQATISAVMRRVKRANRKRFSLAKADNAHYFVALVRALRRYAAVVEAAFHQLQDGLRRCASLDEVSRHCLFVLHQYRPSITSSEALKGLLRARLDDRRPERLHIDAVFLLRLISGFDPSQGPSGGVEGRTSPAPTAAAPAPPSERDRTSAFDILAQKEARPSADGSSEMALPSVLLPTVSAPADGLGGGSGTASASTSAGDLSALVSPGDYKLVGLLEGEDVIHCNDRASLFTPSREGVDVWQAGTLLITNYRLIFLAFNTLTTQHRDYALRPMRSDARAVPLALPLLHVADITHPSHGDAGSTRVAIRSKTFRNVQISFDASPQWVAGFAVLLRGLAFPSRIPQQTFALVHGASQQASSAAPKDRESGDGATAGAADGAAGGGTAEEKSAADAEVGAGEGDGEGSTEGAAGAEAEEEEEEAGSESESGQPSAAWQAPDTPVSGWSLYDVEADLRRVGLAGSSEGRRWRVARNDAFELCATYPEAIAVPAALTSAEISAVAAYRSKGRLPATVWRHPGNKTVLARCSQPLAGLGGQRCPEDEHMLDVLRRRGAPPAGEGEEEEDDSPLYIVDARKYLAAEGNRVRGGGIEAASNYAHARVLHMNVENIHVMRDSLHRLHDLCTRYEPAEASGDWLQQLDRTSWLKHIRLIVAAACTVVRIMHREQCCVLLHCSDGWDRTAQMSALAQIILDPYYRTRRGFAEVVEKEFLAFGHKFQDRLAHGVGDPHHHESSPVFLQFLDSVWQVTQQHPRAFEFTSAFLVAMADASTSGQYGTFFCNSVRERRMLQLSERTRSAWDDLVLGEETDAFVNESYSPSNFPLPVSADARFIRLWEDYYLRWDPDVRWRDAVYVGVSGEAESDSGAA